MKLLGLVAFGALFLFLHSYIRDGISHYGMLFFIPFMVMIFGASLLLHCKRP